MIFLKYQKKLPIEILMSEVFILSHKINIIQYFTRSISFIHCI